MKRLLMQAKGAVEEWLWEHYGDAFDAHLQWRHSVAQRLRDARCWFIGHKVEYSPPGPWDWDGEYHAYCDRCDPEGEGRALFYKPQSNTLPWMLLDAYWNLRWRLGLDKADG